MHKRRQHLISVQPYDDYPYWGGTPFWQNDEDDHPGCVSMDPFGTNQMAAIWAAHDSDSDPIDEKDDGPGSDTTTPC